MNYWVLQMNPNMFPVTRDYSLDRVQGKRDWWGITKYLNKMEKDDVIFIWHSIDKRNSKVPKDRGIYATGKVISVPPHTPDVQKQIDQLKQQEGPQFLEPTEKTKQEAKPSIFIQYVKSYTQHPLTYHEMVDADLDSIHIITYPNQEICILSESEATEIIKLLEAHTSDPPPNS